MERRKNFIIFLFLLLLALVPQRSNTALAQASYPAINWNQCYLARSTVVRTGTAPERIFWFGSTSFYSEFSIGERVYFDARVLRNWRVYTTRNDLFLVYWTNWRFSGNVVYPQAVIINVNGTNYRTYSPNDNWASNAHGYWFAPMDSNEIGDIYLCADPPPLLPTPTPLLATNTPSPTNAPSYTPQPTVTPTYTPSSGGGSGGGGSGGSGGNSTQVPDWCGLVPSNPCWVIWATQEANNEQQTQIVLEEYRRQTEISLLETVAARAAQPTETPFALNIRETAQAVADNGVGAPVPFTQVGNEEIAEAYGYTFFVTRRYDFGCPLVWENWATICIEYVYISDIQLYPNRYLPTTVFVGALVLIIFGFVIRR